MFTLITLLTAQFAVRSSSLYPLIALSTTWLCMLDEKLTGRASSSFRCSTCEKCFSCKFFLQTQECVHSGEKPFLCNTCGKAFRQRSYLLTNHKRLCTLIKIWPHIVQRLGRGSAVQRVVFTQEYDGGTWRHSFW